MTKAVGTVDTVSRENLVKFEVGTTCRSFNENGDYVDYKIKARTAKMVTLEDRFGDENHKKISVDDIGEYVKLTKGICLSAKSVVDVEKENALMRICEVVSEGMTLYEQVKADGVVLETIYKMVKEYYAKAISDIKATENLLASGVIKAEDLRADSGINIDFEVIDNSYDKAAYAAGLIIRGAKLEENEFVYSKCKNLNYLTLTIKAIKKVVELFLDKDASELDVEFKTSEENAVSVEVETVVFTPKAHIGIEELMTMPASELRKTTDYNFWQNKIMEYEKEMASLKNGSALKESYEKTLEYYKDELAKARKAMYSVENGVEDDGSNDDDYDEEEITVYTPAVEEEDDDELIDPPEEVTIEEKEIKKFEVGKIYFFIKTGVYGDKSKEMYKVVKRTKKRIMFQWYDPNFEIDEDEVDVKCKTEDITIGRMKFESGYDVYLPSLTERIWLGETYTPEIYASDEVKVEESTASVIAIPKEMEMAVYEPVTFAIERFNEGVEGKSAGLVDTSVAEVSIDSTYAEIEDEIKCKLAAIEGLKLEVKALREQLKALKKKIAPFDKKHMQEVIGKFKKVCGIASKKDAMIGLKTQTSFGEEYYWVECDWDLLNCYYSSADKYNDYEPEAVILFDGLDVAYYKDSNQFEKVVADFAAAIERGDEEFTFPNEKAQ